jgi:putative DNA primase/helicase
LVFGDKRPAIAGGFHSASAEAEFVEREFASGSRGVGIRTGESSGLVVLDVDPRNGGDASLERMLEMNGPLPDTLTARTGSGGKHIYFRMPGEEVRCHTNLGGWSGIDLKAEGGYVVAPPSRLSLGGTYEWTTPEGPDAPIADMPNWLLELVKVKAKPIAASSSPNRAIGLSAEEGSRNTTIFKLARQLRDTGLSESTVAEMACQANASFSPPLDEAEVRRTVASVFTRGPFEAFPITDMGNARRLVALADGNFRYEPMSKRWLHWSAGVWGRDEDGEVLRLAREVVRQVEDDAKRIEDPDARKNAMIAARRQQNSARLNAMVELAKSEPEIPVTAHRLDRHPFLLNAPNGVIDLQTGTLKPHDRSLLLTKILPFAYDPDAKCPRFLEVLDQVFQGNAEIISFVQRMFGYAATGDAREQVFFILVGAGANGKSTLLNATSHVLGVYAGHTPSETLISHKMGRSASNDLARLDGVRLVTASEFNPGEKLATGLVKQLTGNEKVTARYLFQEYREFHFTAKLMLATNDIPHMQAADDALFRRVVIVPFDRVFAKSEQDPMLFDKLKEEAPGILAWIVKGAVEWLRTGLQVPETLVAIRDSIRRDMDPLAQFLEDACLHGGTFETTSAALHAAFALWGQRHGIPHMDGRSFGKALSKRGHRSRKSNGRMVVQGLKLRPEFQSHIHLAGDAA